MWHDTSGLNSMGSRMVRNEPLSYSVILIEKKTKRDGERQLVEVLSFESEMSLKGSSFEYSQLAWLFWKAGRPLGSGNSWWKEATVRRHWKVIPHSNLPDFSLDLFASWSTTASLPYVLDAMNSLHFSHHGGTETVWNHGPTCFFFLSYIAFVRSLVTWILKSLTQRVSKLQTDKQEVMFWCTHQVLRHWLLTQACGSLWVPLT